MINLSNLPNTIGVYIFKKGKDVLYIGKSINIKARIASHIENSKIDPKTFLFINQSDKIEYITTDSDFKASLLEAELIKKFQPKYNVRWKDNKSYLYIKITIADQYPKVLLSRRENDGKSLYFGPFASTKITNNIIREIRKIIPFCTQKQITKKPCFYSKINLCQPCPNMIESSRSRVKFYRKLKKEYRQNIKKLIKILQGKGEKIIKELEKKLYQFSKNLQFEEAINIRNRIFRLQKLLQMSLEENGISVHDRKQKFHVLASISKLLKKYFPEIKTLKRIECYDVSNLSLKEATASMVVLVDGVFDKSQYRRFKIKNLLAKSDFEMLTEVLKRRFKNNWDKPNLIVVDGGKPQVRNILNILTQLKLNIPIIGIAKNPDRLVIGKYHCPTLKLPSNHPGFNLLQLMRDEAHRFAKKYHLLLRKKIFV